MAALWRPEEWPPEEDEHGDTTPRELAESLVGEVVDRVIEAAQPDGALEGSTELGPGWIVSTLRDPEKRQGYVDILVCRNAAILQQLASDDAARDRKKRAGDDGRRTAEVAEAAA